MKFINAKVFQLGTLSWYAVYFQYLYIDLFELVGSFVSLSCMVAVLLAIVSISISMSFTEDIERGMAYECGFLPFDRSRTRFDVNFFVVGLLFLLFDLEVVFLLPWGVEVLNLTLVGFGGGVVFISVLSLAFFIELMSKIL